MFQGIRLGALTTKSKLNQGAEACVWHVVDRIGNSFAVKAYKNPPSKYMRNEVSMQNKLGRHRNISSPLDDAFRMEKHRSNRTKTPKTPNALVFRYYAGGDLVDYYRMERQVYSDDRLLQAMEGLWKALSHCHSKGVCHRDVKPQNILYDRASHTVMLTDFGMSSNSTEITRAGTSLYHSAPECFARKQHPPYNYKCDVWSSGTTFLTMVSGSYILEGNHGHNIRLHGHKYVKKNFSETWSRLSDISRAILVATLVPNPQDRCEADDIVKLLA